VGQHRQRLGEVVRIGGSPNGNQRLSIPAGVTLTTEGVPAYTEPPAGTNKGLAYHRLGRIVPYTSPATPANNPADGWVCAGFLCNNIGMVTLASGSHLVGVWVGAQGLGDTNYKLAIVQTAGSAAPNSATPYDDGTTIVASRVSEPGRDGTAIRAEGASLGSACVNERITGNLVTGYSSKHQFDRRGQAQWVDGIVVNCEDTKVAQNSVVDVTDQGITVNGSVDRSGVVTRQHSEVHDNTVLSAGQDTHVALGADAVGTCSSLAVVDANGVLRPGWIIPCLDVYKPRDFTGTSIHDNRFFTGPRTSFDVALLVGGGAKWGDHKILNQGPDVAHPGFTGALFLNNTTGGVATRANVGIDVHDMTHATVVGNTNTFVLVDGNPRVAWNKCPLAQRLTGATEAASLTTDATFTTDDGSRGCVIGAPPSPGIENIRITADGSGFEGSVTGTPFRIWGGDLNYTPNISVSEMTDDFRDVRRMGANVIRLLLEAEHFLDAPACTGCPPTANTEALNHLGDVATAAEQVGLYLDITGLGIAYLHDNNSWYDNLDGSPAGEQLRWQAQSVFWQGVANELKGNTSIAWYDLMNEPTLGAPATTWCFTPNTPTTEPCWAQNIAKNLTDPDDPNRQRTPLEVAEDWLIMMRDAIKIGAGDTIHPVSVGNIFCGGALADASHNVLDFYLLHEYPLEATVQTSINEVNNCKRPGKPLVVEETYYTAPSALDQFFNATKAKSAGYLGHFIGGTPSQLNHVLTTTNPENNPNWWPAVIWRAWDNYFLRGLLLRNPVGPGIMPT
jgi:hypothetical protein